MAKYNGLNATLVHNLNKKIEELRASEEKFRIIFEGASDGILVADAKTKKFVFANPKICELTGYNEKELLKLGIENIHSKKDLPYVLDQFTKQLQGKIDMCKDIPVLRKDKKIVYCDINAAPLKIKDQEVAVGFFRDITDRKKAEESLKQSEEKYRTIVENAIDYIFVLDKNQRFISINKNAARLSGKSPEELIGKSIFTMFPKESATRFAKNNKEVIETGKSKFIDEKMIVKGREFYINTIMNPIKDSKGNVVAVMGIVRDITDRKKVEEELKKKIQELEKLKKKTRNK